MREGEGETADEPAAGRLDRGSGQGAAEIRLTDPGDPQPSRRGVVTQPPERKLIGDRERDQRVRDRVPVADETGISNREVECCVR